MVTSGDADDAQPADDARPGTTSDVTLDPETPDPETTPEAASPDSARGPDSEVRAYRRDPQDREPERVGRAGLVLRMLRLGAVLTLPVLWCAPWMSMLPFGQKTSASLIVWPLLFLGGAWLFFPLSREGPISRVLSVIVLVMADEVTLHSVVRAVWDWWSTYRQWGVTSNRSLYIAASLLALGLFLTSHYLVRTRYPAAPLNLQGAGLRSGTYAVVRRITIGTAPLPPWHRLTILPSSSCRRCSWWVPSSSCPACPSPSPSSSPLVCLRTPGLPCPRRWARLWRGRGRPGPRCSTSPPGHAVRSFSPRTAWRP